MVQSETDVLLLKVDVKKLIEARGRTSQRLWGLNLGATGQFVNRWEKGERAIPVIFFVRMLKLTGKDYEWFLTTKETGDGETIRDV